MITVQTLDKWISDWTDSNALKAYYPSMAAYIYERIKIDLEVRPEVQLAGVLRKIIRQEAKMVHKELAAPQQETVTSDVPPKFYEGIAPLTSMDTTNRGSDSFKKTC